MSINWIEYHCELECGVYFFILFIYVFKLKRNLGIGDLPKAGERTLKLSGIKFKGKFYTTLF